MNLPNALTVARMALVPVLAWLLWIGDDASLRWAAVVFVVASLTDIADGAIARRRGQQTDLGATLDPIADKALTGTALIGLSLLGRLPWWVTIVILVRELGVTAMRVALLRHGVLPASRGGKAKTFSQVVAIVMLLAAQPVGAWGVACAIAVAIAVVLTVATGIDYVVRARRLRRSGLGERQEPVESVP